MDPAITSPWIRVGSHWGWLWHLAVWRGCFIGFIGRGTVPEISVIRDGVKTHRLVFNRCVDMCSFFFPYNLKFVNHTLFFWMFLLLFLEVIEFMIIIIWYLNDCNKKESQRPRMLLGAHVALRLCLVLENFALSYLTMVNCPMGVGPNQRTSE